jgi:hypothetical protein
MKIRISFRQRIERQTWKFFSFQPFLAKNLTTSSLSTSSTIPSSSQAIISSRAARRVFQLASPKPSRICAGIKSKMRSSASSGVKRNLNVSVATGGADLAEALAPAWAATFLPGGADLAAPPDASAAPAGFLAP